MVVFSLFHPLSFCRHPFHQRDPRRLALKANEFIDTQHTDILPGIKRLDLRLAIAFGKLIAHTLSASAIPRRR